MSRCIDGLGRSGELRSLASCPGGLDYAEPISGYSGCTTRTYGFDSASNRTSYTSYAPADGGDCQTTTATVSKTSTYDTGDRVTNTGYTYDTLGRTTTVPSADTENAAGDLTATYHVNDLVRTLTQAGTTTTYTLDVNQSRVRSWTDGSTTSTDHYDTDSDSPAWTAIGSTYKRDIAGPDGALAATYDSSSGNIRIQITDLHGDVLGVASNNLTTDPGILATFETDEYGNPHDPGDTGDVRYGYLGEHQRAADNPAGITLMGVRLYNPTTARFLSIDPVKGGSCNDYEYVCGDPINHFDLDGRSKCKIWCYTKKQFWSVDSFLSAGSLVDGARTIAKSPKTRKGWKEGGSTMLFGSGPSYALGGVGSTMFWWGHGIRAARGLRVIALYGRLIELATGWPVTIVATGIDMLGRMHATKIKTYKNYGSKL